MTEQKIVHIRLSDGKELLTKHIGFSEWEDYIVEDPMIIDEVIIPNTNKAHFVLYSFLPYSNPKITVIQKRHIISSVETDRKVNDLYQLAVSYHNKNIEPRIDMKIMNAIGTYQEFEFENDIDQSFDENNIHLILPEKNDIH